MSTADAPFEWRPLILAAFAPTALFSIGEGAILPIIPVVADDLGATLAMAGLIAGLIMIGELAGDIPSGWLVARIGERQAMIGAAALSLVGLFLAMYSVNEVMLALGIFLVGLATAVFALARHAFMTTYVPVRYRARALSTLGGVFRLGVFVGPLLSAGLLHFTGDPRSVFWIMVVGSLGAALLLLFLPDPTATFGRTPREGDEFVAREAHGLFGTLWRYRGVLVKLGSGAALIGAMRSSRTVILPLWAVSLGLPETTTALIIGLAGAVDFALFYTSGAIMDRFGRLWSALPSMIGLGLGHLVLSLTHDVPAAVGWFIGVALFLSVANGIGSGILMTLGADLADPADPAPFLGAWRFVGDAGNAGAPLIVAAMTATVSISAAAGVMGVLGFLGAGILARYLPRYSPRR
jgi:MFS family permease